MLPGQRDDGHASAQGGRGGSAPRHRRRLLAAAVPVAVIVAVVLAGVAWANRERPPEGRAGVGPVASSAPSPPCGFADEFTGDAVDSRWEQVRKGDGSTVADGAMALAAPNGSDIYPQHLDAPMLLQTPTGDFTLEADVVAAPRQFYQGAGLVLWHDPEHYVRLERGFGDVGAIALEYRDGGRHTRVHAPFTAGPAVVRTEAGRVVLQLRKTAGAVTARWRPFGEAAWQDLGRIAVALPDSTKAGVAALNRAQNGAAPAPFEVRFDYVRVSC
jgi:regulation of enolase protein 1 (concanavalin A-like superfamily)